MKILFYLPVVTPWWFDNIVLPLVLRLAKEAEVHVIVPPLWKNTGITEQQLIGARAAENVRWHIVEDAQHPTLRTRPADPRGLIEFVRSLDPDYTFCRSADAETPAEFPGQVRYLMESGAPPLPGIGRTFVLQKDLLQQGEMPALTPFERDAVDAEFGPAWKRFRRRFESRQSFKATREKALAGMGIDPSRKVIALPLEYAHDENFFRIHEKFPDAAELVEQLARRLHDDTVLAVTDHPLNYLYADTSAVHRAIEALGSRARLVANEAKTPKATNMLLKHCDGAIVQNSKSIYAAAYFGKPILRLADRATASWLRASTDIDTYFEEIRTGSASAPEDADVRTWFGLRLMHDVIDPFDVSAAELIERCERPFEASRLAAGLERFEQIERAYLRQR